MQERHFFSISKELIDSVNSHLYGGNANYTYGSYSFTEVELNEMKGTEDYYVTDYTIPIVNAIPFDSIRDPPQINLSSIHRQITDLYGDLPEKKSVDIQCRQCHLHFSSERQLKRHQRTHQSSADMEEAPSSERVEEPAMPSETGFKRQEKVSEEKAKRLALRNDAEEVQLDTADGSLLLQRDDYDAVLFYLGNPVNIHTRTIEAYLPSLRQMWKQKQSRVCFKHPRFKEK